MLVSRRVKPTRARARVSFADSRPEAKRGLPKISGTFFWGAPIISSIIYWGPLIAGNDQKDSSAEGGNNVP